MNDMTPIEQLRAALEGIDALINLLECSNPANLALLPLFLEQQKRALAALPLIRVAALEEAARVAMDHPSGSYAVAAAIRTLKTVDKSDQRG